MPATKLTLGNIECALYLVFRVRVSAPESGGAKPRPSLGFAGCGGASGRAERGMADCSII